MTGDQLAREVQRRLARAGLRDVSILALDPNKGRRMVVRRGSTMHRMEAVPLNEGRTWQNGTWHPLVVASKLTEAQAAELGYQGVSFIDELGHANLAVDGAVAASSEARTHRPDRGGTGLSLKRASHQVAFALLCAPDLAGATAREVAAVAGVSLGTAHSTLVALTEHGYVRHGSLRRAARLLDVWAEAYARVPFPPLTQKRLYAAGSEWIDRQLVDPVPGVWASGPAAAGLLVDGFRATDGIAYIEDVARAVPSLRLSPTPSPFAVSLRTRFWGAELPTPRPGLAPSPLIYGDLLRDGESRAAEAAGELREQDATLRAIDAR